MNSMAQVRQLESDIFVEAVSHLMCLSLTPYSSTITEETPFEGGTWRIKLVLGQDYPQAPPRGFFLTKIYHPNVSANGDICVNTLKKDWNESVTLSHVLAVVRCLLIVPFPESSLNDEAGKLFMDNYDDYAERARIMTQIHALRKGRTVAAATSGAADAEVTRDGAAVKVADDSEQGGPSTRQPNSTENSSTKANADKSNSSSDTTSSVKKAKENSVNGKVVTKEKKKQKENKKKGLKRL